MNPNFFFSPSFAFSHFVQSSCTLIKRNFLSPRFFFCHFVCSWNKRKKKSFIIKSVKTRRAFTQSTYKASFIVAKRKEIIWIRDRKSRKLLEFHHTIYLFDAALLSAITDHGKNRVTIRHNLNQHSFLPEHRLQNTYFLCCANFLQVPFKWWFKLQPTQESFSRCLFSWRKQIFILFLCCVFVATPNSIYSSVFFFSSSIFMPVSLWHQLNISFVSWKKE